MAGTMLPIIPTCTHDVHVSSSITLLFQSARYVPQSHKRCRSLLMRRVIAWFFGSPPRTARAGRGASGAQGLKAVALVRTQLFEGVGSISQLTSEQFRWSTRSGDSALGCSSKRELNGS